MKTIEEKLLEDFAPRLTLGLKVVVKQEELIKTQLRNEVAEVCCLSTTSGYRSVNVVDEHRIEMLHLEDVIPIYRPLSDLLKPITQKNWNDGKEFTPIDFFEVTDDNDTCPIEQDYGNVKLITLLKGISKHNVINDIKFLPNWVVKQLHYWHFNTDLEEGEYIPAHGVKANVY